MGSLGIFQRLFPTSTTPLRVNLVGNGSTILHDSAIYPDIAPAVALRCLSTNKLAYHTVGFKLKTEVCFLLNASVRHV